MDSVRKPLQGVWNIIRFNWQFYILALVLVFALLLVTYVFRSAFLLPAWVLCTAIISGTLLSLLASLYVYDLSGFYTLKLLNSITTVDGAVIININAGFDETSVLLHNKYSSAALTVFDFYDPVKHTEVSIKRARNAYPPYPGTVIVKTTKLP